MIVGIEYRTGCTFAEVFTCHHGITWIGRWAKVSFGILYNLYLTFKLITLFIHNHKFFMFASYPKKGSDNAYYRNQIDCNISRCDGNKEGNNNQSNSGYQSTKQVKNRPIKQAASFRSWFFFDYLSHCKFLLHNIQFFIIRIFKQQLNLLLNKMYQDINKYTS